MRRGLKHVNAFDPMRVAVSFKPIPDEEGTETA